MVTQMAMGMTIKTSAKRVEHLKPYQFKPGNNANPHGRPKKEISITSKVKELLEHEVDAVARRVVDELKKPFGKYPTGLFCEVLNRVEGRVPGDMPVGFNDNRTTNIIVLDGSTKELIGKIHERTGKLIEGSVQPKSGDSNATE